MDYSINTKPLLESSDSEEDINSNLQQEETLVVNEKPLFKPTEPIDKYNMAYIIFYLLGVITLLPWNFFITADDVRKLLHLFYSCSVILIVYSTGYTNLEMFLQILQLFQREHPCKLILPHT